MAKKGEKLDPELVARMAEARRVKRWERQQRESAEENVRHAVAVNERIWSEDVSLPTGYGSAGGESEKEPADLPLISDPSDPYSMWLLALDGETRQMFTDVELRATFDEHWTKAQAEKKTRKKKEIADLALQTARSQQGLMPAQTVENLQVARLNAKPVSMMVQMPPSQEDGGPADVGLRVNGQVIANGKRHYCTYGEAASLREMLYRLGQMELLFKGEKIKYRAYLMSQAMGSVNMRIEVDGRGVVR